MRSQAEIDLENHIISKYPNLRIVCNDRSIIPSRRTTENLEIDIYIPTLKLGFEINGETIHNHYAYIKDLENKTDFSEEMYKERYCAGVGIKLVNCWTDGSRDSINAISRIMDSEIEQAISQGMATYGYYSKENHEEPDKRKSSYFEEQRKSDGCISGVLFVFGVIGLIVALTNISDFALPSIIGVAISILLFATAWDMYKQSKL